MHSKSITYRELRNTPGQVFERLAAGEPLSLVAEGTTKAILIPVADDDVATVLDAWQRGRALLALARLQSEARRTGASELPKERLTGEIAAARKARRRRGAGG